MDREWMSTLARQLSGRSVKILLVLLSGDAGSASAILTDIQHADLVADWDQGVRALLRTIR